MGLIEGAIIGGAIGGVVSITMLLKRNSRQKKLLKLIQSQDPQAVDALNRSIPPVTIIPLSRIEDQRDRMAALTLLNQKDALWSELQAHQGALTATTQINAIGYLGLVLLGEPDAAKNVQTLADKIETEGGALLKLVKKNTRTLASLAGAITGEKVEKEALLRANELAKVGGLSRLLIWQALAIALKSAGKEQAAEDYFSRVRSLTAAFDS